MFKLNYSTDAKLLSLVNSLASTNKTVNSYTLAQIFRSKNLEKMKMWAHSSIKNDIFCTARQSDGAVGPIYGAKQLSQGQTFG